MRFKQLLKEAVYGSVSAVGLPRLGQRFRRDGLTILTYHSFGPAADHPYLFRMPADRMRAQLAHLKRHYDVVTVATGLGRLAAGLEVRSGRAMVAITVDDGYGDNFEHLFPLLREAGVPATIFVATDYIDSGRLPWPTRLGALLHFASVDEIAAPVRLPLRTVAERQQAGRVLRQHLSRLAHVDRDAVLEALQRDLAPARHQPLPPLTWDQVRRMRDSGIDFGSHTHHHGWLDRLGAAEVEEELSVSRRRIESELGQPCRSLAYPNGNWSDAVATAASSAGYTAALTQERGVNRRRQPGPMGLYRLEIPYDEWLGTFACRVAGVAA